MEQDKRGYKSIEDKYICSKCVSDYAIKEFIEENCSHNECSYCERKSKKKISVHFDEFAEFVLEGISTEFGDPNDECVGWEQGWVGKVFDSYDLLQDEIEIELESENLFKDLVESLSDRQWCKRNFYGLSPSQTLKYGWSRFVGVIKHKSRYVFLGVSEEEDASEHIPPNRFLDAFGAVAKGLELVRNLPAGSDLFRLRIHGPEVSLSSAAELGSPPDDVCIFANRMSPAGISMFYCAPDKETCVFETYDPDGEKHCGTFGRFNNVRDLTLLDMTKIPASPSMFEPGSRDMRHNIIFFREFLADFTRKVSKDGREHIEYVPTQVISEYVRYALRIGTARIDGIVYRSSRNTKKEAIVLFFDSETCGNSGESKSGTELILVDTSRQTFTSEDT